MTNEKIIEYNKLIAEFMNIEFDNYIDIKGRHGVTIKGTQYHCSWDWLMPVVGKIELMGYIFSIESYCVSLYEKNKELQIKSGNSFIAAFNGIHGNNMLELIYEVVVSFLKLINLKKNHFMQLNYLDNKIIANFMNLKSYQDDKYGEMWPDPTDINYKLGFELKYDKSWNWLMTVIEKIREDMHAVILNNKSCTIIISNDEKQSIHKDENTSIESAYKAVLEFIKWYNESK